MSDLSLLPPEDLLLRARAFAADAPDKDDEDAWDGYWELISELHARDEETIWRSGVLWTQSALPWERWLGIDILSQYGCLVKPRVKDAHGFWETTPGWPDTPQGLRAQHLVGLRLTDADERVVAHALSALGHLGGAGDFLEHLWPLVGHPHEAVRQAAIHVLAHHPHEPGTLPALIALSRDERDSVRDWATFGLGNLADFHGIDTPALRNALVDRLDDADFDARGEALAALAALHDPRVLEPLCGALAADEVGTLAVEAAETLGNPVFLPLLLELQAWWDVDTNLLERAITACNPHKP